MDYELVRRCYTYLLASFAVFFAVATPAAAAEATELCGGDNLGQMFCSFQQSSVSKVAMLILAASFVGGIFLMIRGITLLMKVSDAQSGGDASLGGALLHLAGGTFLVGLPATITIGLGSLGFSGSPWLIGAEAPGDTGAPIQGTDFLAMVGNFAVNAAGPLTTLIMGIAVIIGIFLVASSLFGLAKLSAPNSRESAGAIGVKFAIGILMVNIFWVIDVVSVSFGIETNQMAVYEGMSGRAGTFAQEASQSTDLTERFNSLMDLAFLALIPFGLLAFVRGLLIVKSATDGSGQQTMGAGATHILGGVALVNGEKFSCAVMETLTGAASFCS
jgi:hypothetical protein